MGQVYTRGGDKGSTSLGDGSRVSKGCRRIAVNGAIDETMSILGLARSFATGAVAESIKKIQSEFINVMGRVSKAVPDAKISSTAEIEAEIERIRVIVPMPNVFVLPGDSQCGAGLHMARSTIRRAEREAVALAQEEDFDPQLLAYLNRMADLFFAMALWADYESKKG